MTAGREAAYLEQRLAYNDRVERVGLRNTSAPPTMPGELLVSLPISLEGASSTYDTAAGSGAMWQGTWSRKPREFDDTFDRTTAIRIGFEDGARNIFALT